jgi:hypothetical protein
MTNDRFALAREEAERLVRAGLTYDRVSMLVGVSASSVRNWTNRYGWPRGPAQLIRPLVPAEDRTSADSEPGAQSAPAVPRKKPKRKKSRPVDRAGLIQRLYAAIENNLQALEQRMNDDTTPSAVDGERDARALGTAIRNLEKVTELETGPQRNAQHRDRGRTAEDADRLRRELAERILRLRRQRGEIT